MSRNSNNDEEIRIQFAVKKGDMYFDVLEAIFEKYPSNVKATSIKEAMKDLLLIFETTETENSSDLIKKYHKLIKNNF